MKHLITFLKNQKLLVIASHHAKDIWVANVYFGADTNGTLYFISPEKTKHSQMILKNQKIAFSVVWFDPKNHKNRKAVQGLGICRRAKGTREISKGIQLLYQNFPDLRDMLTVKWIKNNIWGTKVWVVKPSSIKFWNDEVYGEDETKEFTFK